MPSKKNPDRTCATRACPLPRYPGLAICRKHARQKADRLWSNLTPKERCEGLGRIAHKCGGMLVAGHGFSRIYSATRWDRSNRWVICSGLNWLIESRKQLEWDDFMKSDLGELAYEEMRHRAITGPEPDLVKVIEDLSAGRGLKAAA